jgi:hypothetical protein
MLYLNFLKNNPRERLGPFDVLKVPKTQNTQNKVSCSTELNTKKGDFVENPEINAKHFGNII